MYKVKNKWNGKEYFVIADDNGKEVMLEREDHTVFTIQKSEFLFSYARKNSKNN